jgi:hypothetical protein
MYLAKAVLASDGRLFDTAHQFCKNEVKKDGDFSYFDFYLGGSQISSSSSSYLLFEQRDYG